MIDNAISIYCFLDDYFKIIKHREDSQRSMTDAEVILTAILASLYFGGHHQRALTYVKEQGLCHQVLSKSRFNRRLHSVEDLVHEVFRSVGQTFKDFNTSMEYVLDSFPIGICHNIRIASNKLLPLQEEYRGKCVSKREYFYGFRVQVIATIKGVPVEFAITPGRWGDTTGMKLLDMHLPQGSRVICDSAYTFYEYEDLFMECENIWHDSQRRSNSIRKKRIIEVIIKMYCERLLKMFSLK
jgi:hypothetical protein